MQNYFQLFGIEESLNIDLGELKKRFYELSKTVHPDRYAQHQIEDAEAIEQTAQLNLAYKTLASTDKRIEYILKTHGFLSELDKPQLDADFLMEMMDINEAIMEAKALSISVSKQVLLQVESFEHEILNQINTVINLSGTELNPKILTELETTWLKRKYILRIKDSLNTFANP